MGTCGIERQSLAFMMVRRDDTKVQPRPNEPCDFTGGRMVESIWKMEDVLRRTGICKTRQAKEASDRIFPASYEHLASGRVLHHTIWCIARRLVEKDVLTHWECSENGIGQAQPSSQSERTLAAQDST